VEGKGVRRMNMVQNHTCMYINAKNLYQWGNKGEQGEGKPKYDLFATL
jgi:hypothetical protein